MQLHCGQIEIQIKIQIASFAIGVAVAVGAVAVAIAAAVAAHFNVQITAALVRHILIDGRIVQAHGLAIGFNIAMATASKGMMPLALWRRRCRCC